VFGLETAPHEYVIDIGTPAGYARAQREQIAYASESLTDQRRMPA